jgi:uncharacterized membrane protein required for colicin V production
VLVRVDYTIAPLEGLVLKHLRTFSVWIVQTILLVCFIFILIVAGNAIIDRFVGVGFDICPHIDGCRGG